MTRYLVTIGTFDGVHRGHRALARWILRRARRLRLKTRVVLFSAPPRFYFHPQEALPLLTTPVQRRGMFLALGIDRVDVLRFGPRWAKMPHTRFFEDWLVRRWKAGGVLVGRDFAFGRGRKGDLAYLEEACARRKMTAGALPLLKVGGEKISSSRIRRLLERGDARGAAARLGRPHAVSGRVVRGAGLGKKLGFPTANLAVPSGVLLPRGVFKVRVSGRGLNSRAAVCNVGTRPTLGGGPGKLVVEVHIPRFSGSLYGRTLTVEFLRRLRPERRFPDLEALKRQIAKDVASVA